MSSACKQYQEGLERINRRERDVLCAVVEESADDREVVEVARLVQRGPEIRERQRELQH